MISQGLGDLRRVPVLLVLDGRPLRPSSDKIDSYKIAALLRGGNLPQAYVYPSGMRATRDVLRRELFFVRLRGGLYTHIQNTITQYNLEPFERRPRPRSASSRTFFTLRF